MAQTVVGPVTVGTAGPAFTVTLIHAGGEEPHSLFAVTQSKPPVELLFHVTVAVLFGPSTTGSPFGVVQVKSSGITVPWRLAV